MDLERIGVYPVIAIASEPVTVLRDRAGNPEEAIVREQKAFKAIRPLMEQMDMFLWLPLQSTTGDRRWERLLEGLPVRGIHFHWISGNVSGRGAEDTLRLSRMYQRAILNTEYTKVSRVTGPADLRSAR